MNHTRSLYAAEKRCSIAARAALGTVASITLVCGAALATMIATQQQPARAAVTAAAPAHTAPVPATPKPAWPASWPGQVGETCLATSTNMLLHSYGIDSDLATYEQALYVPGWNVGPNVTLADSYLKVKGLQLLDRGTPDASDLDGPGLVEVNTAGLPWWKVSSAQGAHELVLLGSADGVARVWDPGFAKYESIPDTELAATSYDLDVVAPAPSSN